MGENNWLYKDGILHAKTERERETRGLFTYTCIRLLISFLLSLMLEYVITPLFYDLMIYLDSLWAERFARFIQNSRERERARVQRPATFFQTPRIISAPFMRL